jgi:hypothetical protein
MLKSEGVHGPDSHCTAIFPPGTFFLTALLVPILNAVISERHLRVVKLSVGTRAGSNNRPGSVSQRWTSTWWKKEVQMPNLKTHGVQQVYVFQFKRGLQFHLLLKMSAQISVFTQDDFNNQSDIHRAEGGISWLYSPKAWVCWVDRFMSSTVLNFFQRSDFLVSWWRSAFEYMPYGESTSSKFSFRQRVGAIYWENNWTCMHIWRSKSQ